MEFGQIIKKLRLDSSMTQEQLAELLSISPQAVSRWETLAAMPDISLLPPLANLFHVTTDYLLGMDSYQKDLRRKEYDSLCRNYWEMEDKEECCRKALEAVTEYPGEMKYMQWLADAEYYVALAKQDEKEYRNMLERAILHYKIVLEHSSGNYLWEKALYGVVLALHYTGKNSEAKKYAMLQEEEEKRDELLNWCLEGEEKALHSQKMLQRKLSALLLQLGNGERRPEAYEAVEQILKMMIPDENYLFYHNTLQYNCIGKALFLCDRKCYDEAIKELQKARFHAGEMAKVRTQKSYQYTAPLFDRIKGENEDTDVQLTELADFCSCLNNNHCFDAIREREDFKALEQ